MKKIVRFTEILLVISAFFGSCDALDDSISTGKPLIQEEPQNEIQNDRVVLPQTRLTLPDSEKNMIAPSNEFSLRYFRNVYEVGSNMLLSPLGIQMTLAMIGNLVKDDMPLCEMLGFKGKTIGEVNGYFKHLIEDFSGEKCGKELKMANALMSDVKAKKYPEEFMDILKTSYYADYLEIVAASISDQPVGSRPEDLWCQEKTGGMIKSAPFSIQETQSSLLNTICFNGEWQDKFDKSLTTQNRFFVNTKESTQVSMMNKTGKFNYFKNQDFSSVSLPFGDGTYSFSIILPNTAFDVKGLLEKLDSKVWDTMRSSLVKKTIALSIPVFSSSYTRQMLLGYEYKDGINPFDVLAQKVTFLMNEDGASAAAVTQTGIYTSPGRSDDQIEHFTANSPFLYTISETGSGLVVFIGAFTGSPL